MNGQKYPRKFEMIGDSVLRLRVPGGWIVRSHTTYIKNNNDVACSEALIYVSDKDMEWNLEDE